MALKFVEKRPFQDLEVAARKILEIANATEPPGLRPWYSNSDFNRPIEDMRWRIA